MTGPSPEERRAGLLERLMGEIALRAVWLAQRRARRRGDTHEVSHLAAMIVYGNSNHSGIRCALPATFLDDAADLAQANREAVGRHG